jgi:hypothetical protein
MPPRPANDMKLYIDTVANGVVRVISGETLYYWSSEMGYWMSDFVTTYHSLLTLDQAQDEIRNGRLTDARRQVQEAVDRRMLDA